MTQARQFDVVIYGASIAGCTAAVMFARHGVRVALLSPETDTPRQALILHNEIHPLLKHLGLTKQLDNYRAALELRTRSGWLNLHKPNTNYIIDAGDFTSMLSDLARATIGITWIPGVQLESLLYQNETVNGLQIRQQGSDESLRLLARLTVAADGQDSQVAALAKIPAQEISPAQTRYQAVYQGSTKLKAHFWWLNPNFAQTITQSDGSTQIICAPAKTSTQEAEELVKQFIAKLPDGPAITQLSEAHSVKVSPTHREHHTAGLEFIGDARMFLDPLWGSNTTRSLREAEWLANGTVEAIMLTGELETALEKYRRWHQKSTANHLQFTKRLAAGEPFKRRENLLFAAASRDDVSAQRVYQFLTHPIRGDELTSPEALTRALWANMTYRRQQTVPAPQT